MGAPTGNTIELIRSFNWTLLRTSRFWAASDSTAGFRAGGESMRGEPGFFDVDERLPRLSDLGDQLLAFAEVVDFEMFRPELASALAYSDGAQGGRPPFDPVLMFKILVIQAANTLSDELGGVPDQRPPVVPAVSGLGAFGPGSRRAHDLVVPGEADESRRDQAVVRAVRCGASRGGLHRHGRTDCRRLPHRRAQAAQHGAVKKQPSRRGAFLRIGRPGRPSSRTKTATRAGRSSSARPGSAPTARGRPSTSPSRRSAIRTMCRSTANMG